VVDGWTGNFVTFYNSYKNLLQAFERAFTFVMNELSILIIIKRPCPSI